MIKQKDIAALILVVAVSFGLAYYLSSLLISTPEDRSETVTDVQSFDQDYPDPDPLIFHEFSVDPTEDITIEQADRLNPFTRDEED